MRVLVTGATGLLGSHICRRLGDTDFVVAMVRDRLPSRWLNEALQNCVVVQGDIRDFPFVRRVISEYQIDTVLHLAALASVKIANSDPMTAYEVNVMGTVNVLEACRQMNVKTTLVMQTDKIFGQVKEATATSPILYAGPYETSKSCSFLICESYRDLYGMNILLPIATNMYGFDEFNDRIVPNVIRQCLKGERPYIYKEKDIVRQYIYVEDVVDALLFILNRYGGHHGVRIIHNNKPMYESLEYPANLYQRQNVFNIAGETKTQEQVVLEIMKHFPDLTPRYIEGQRTQEVLFETMELTDFGYVPKTSFADGIKQTIELFKKYESK